MRRLTVPAIPPSIMSAVAFLYVSTPAISSGETSANDRPRELFALKLSRPLNSLRTCGRPRITTPEGSAEKCVVSPEAAKRVTVTPVMRCSASATDLSGNAPMSDAVIESTTVSAFLLDFLRGLQRLADAGDEDLGQIVVRLRGRGVGGVRVGCVLLLRHGVRRQQRGSDERKLTNQSARDFFALAASRRNFFDALDTAMPPLYKNWS